VHLVPILGLDPEVWAPLLVALGALLTALGHVLTNVSSSAPPPPPVEPQVPPQVHHPPDGPERL